MSDLATLIKTINSQITEKKTSFVYYEEESGKILKISNRLSEETTEKYLEVGHEEIKDLLTGKRRLEDFYVDYDLSAKNFVVKEHTYKDDLDTINYKLYELPIQNKFSANDTENEILIRQNYFNNHWSVHINKKTKNDLIASHYKSNDVLYFSITAKHDPNILYRTIKCSLRDLIHDRVDMIPFEYDWEFNKEEISVYTPKFFNSYIHEIVE